MKSLSRPILAAAALLIGLIVGWIGGRATFRLSFADNGDAVGVPPRDAQGEKKGAATWKSEPNDVQQGMRDVVHHSMPDSRLNPSFLDFVSQTGGLSEDGLMGALDQFLVVETEKGSYEAKQSILNTLLLRLVALNPVEAGKWMVLHRDVASVESMKEIWTILAQKDLALMAQLIPQLPEASWPTLQEIRLGVLAEQNPAQAAAALEEILSGAPIKNHLYKEAADAVLVKYKRVDPVAAANLSLRLYPTNYVQVGNDQSQHLFHVLESWNAADAAAWTLQQKGRDAALVACMFMREFGGQKLYDQSAELMSNLSGADMNDTHLKSVLGKFADHFMKTGGQEEARKWAAGIADPELRSVAEAQINRIWVQVDPVGASGWLAVAAPAAERDGLIRSLVGRIKYEDPERAFVWAQMVGDIAASKESMIDVMESWLKRDPIAAAHVLQQTQPEFQESIKAVLRRN